MIQIVISTDSAGRDIATHGPYTAKSTRSCAARKLARILVEAEFFDTPIEAIGTDGRLRYTVRSLHAFAKKTLVENPRPHLVPYVERMFPA